jgi:hypothetical protein
MDHSLCQHNAQTIESGFDSFDKELLQQLAVLEDEFDTVATSAVTTKVSSISLQTTVPSLPDTGTCDGVQFLHAFLQQQEARSLVYSEFERGFAAFTVEKDMKAFAGFCLLAKAVTTQFALISANIRSLEATMTKCISDARQSIIHSSTQTPFPPRALDWVTKVRKIQELEREKLELTIAMQAIHSNYLVIKVSSLHFQLV